MVLGYCWPHVSLYELQFEKVPIYKPQAPELLQWLEAQFASFAIDQLFSRFGDDIICIISICFHYIFVLLSNHVHSFIPMLNKVLIFFKKKNKQ